MVFANGGVICTNGSDVLFLKDTDGDDKADVREVLFTGIRTGDTHAGTSNFRYGVDNWIWATTGYSGFGGEVGGEKHNFGSGVFRFKPDASAMEFLQNTTNNTWGLGFSEEFDIHGSTANANPSFYLSFPRRFYEQAGLSQPRTPRADDNPLFFPASTDIRQVDAHHRYTAGAGHAFYTARRFPENYWNAIAFICAPTGKLVGQWVRHTKGAGFELRQEPNNIYNSADAWSGPVCAEVGPDGALWICDWYNLVIQHNPTPNKGSSGLDAQRGKGNAYVTPHRDTQHGRIYRVYPRGTKNDPYKADFASSNMFWRLEAQRAAVEQGHTVDKVENIHQFYAREGNGSLDLETIKAALSSGNQGLKRAALRNAPLDDTLTRMFIVDGKISVKEPRVLLDLLLAFSSLGNSDIIGQTLVNLVSQDAGAIMNDPVLYDAFQVAARRHGGGFVKAALSSIRPEKTKGPKDILPNGNIEKVTSDRPEGWGPRFYGGSRNARYTAVKEGRNGTMCLKVSSDQRSDSGWGATLKVKRNTRYRLGGWIKTENVAGSGSMFNVHGVGHRTKAVRGTTGWTEYSVDFDSGSATEITVHALFGGYGGQTGTAWYDDIYLQETGESGLGGTVLSIASYFGKHASPTAKKHLVTFLGTRAEKGDEFARVLRQSVEAQSPDQRNQTTDNQPPSLVVQLKSVKDQMIFNRKEFTVPAGKRIRVVFENTDSMPHNIVIGKPGSLTRMGSEADRMLQDHPAAVKRGYVPDIPEVIAATGLVFPGETEALDFTAPEKPGKYDFVCTFPGHWRIMKGVMTVK